MHAINAIHTAAAPIHAAIPTFYVTSALPKFHLFLSCEFKFSNARRKTGCDLKPVKPEACTSKLKFINKSMYISMGVLYKACKSTVNYK